jgi:putative membrane protein
MNLTSLRIAAAGVAIAAFALFPATSQDTTSSDKSFLRDAAAGNLFEINLAKLALQKSQDANIRKFATQMIADHSMLAREMRPLDRKLGVREPTGPSLGDRARYEELKLKSGIDFDRAYVATMVKGHNDDLKAFIDEEQKTTNPDVKTLVAKGEQTVREHTQMIDNIAHMGGIPTPPMPAGA